jgi:hypothetical protein
MGYCFDGRDLIPDKDNVLFSIASRPILEPTPPPVQWVQGSGSTKNLTTSI